STSRITGASINTVTKLLVEVGQVCEEFHNGKVRNLTCQRIQCDEIWSFVYSKQKNVPAEKKGEAGDLWTWTALCPDTKLIVSWFVGDRSHNSSKAFIRDVAERVNNRVQISTDGNFAYAEAIEEAWGVNVDYGQI